MSFESLKLLHVVCALLWLGPAIGAYWVLLRLKRHLDHERILWLEKIFEEVLIVEHSAFVGLVASGIMMWRNMGIAWDDVAWLKIKIILVALVLLIEIADVLLCHVYFRIALRRAFSGNTAQWIIFQRARRLFYLMAIPLLGVLIVGILGVAVVGPTIFGMTSW